MFSGARSEAAGDGLNRKTPVHRARAGWRRGHVGRGRQQWWRDRIEMTGGAGERKREQERWLGGGRMVEREV